MGEIMDFKSLALNLNDDIDSSLGAGYMCFVHINLNK